MVSHAAVLDLMYDLLESQAGLCSTCPHNTAFTHHIVDVSARGAGQKVMRWSTVPRKCLISW